MAPAQPIAHSSRPEHTPYGWRTRWIVRPVSNRSSVSAVFSNCKQHRKMRECSATVHPSSSNSASTRNHASQCTAVPPPKSERVRGSSTTENTSCVKAPVGPRECTTLTYGHHCNAGRVHGSEMKTKVWTALSSQCLLHFRPQSTLEAR